MTWRRTRLRISRRVQRRQGFLESDSKEEVQKEERGHRLNLRKGYLELREVAQKEGPGERLEVDEKVRHARRIGDLPQAREEAFLHPLRPIYVHSPGIREILQQEGFQPIEGQFMLVPEGMSRRAAKSFRDEIIKNHKRKRATRYAKGMPQITHNPKFDTRILRRQLRQSVPKNATIKLDDFIDQLFEDLE